MFDDAPLTHEESHERVYRSYKDRFLKRSLAPHEYKLTLAGNVYVPFQNKERLQNEAACLKHIAENTDIPVPKVLDAYEENGAFFLWTELIPGVRMSELEEEDRSKVIPEVLKYLATLQTLRSRRSYRYSLIATRYGIKSLLLEKINLSSVIATFHNRTSSLIL
jgi:aminoglycoside phosphotransferase